jgi:AbrB family looped-hinge helix DNA binding protein
MKKSSKPCSESEKKASTCCKVESVVTIDDRGQMVLPKEIRDAVGIHAGDKLAVIPWKKDDKVCCITLMKVEELTDIVKDKLGPVLKEIL